MHCMVNSLSRILTLWTQKAAFPFGLIPIRRSPLYYFNICLQGRATLSASRCRNAFLLFHKTGWKTHLVWPQLKNVPAQTNRSAANANAIGVARRQHFSGLTRQGGRRRMLHGMGGRGVNMYMYMQERHVLRSLLGVMFSILHRGHVLQILIRGDVAPHRDLCTASCFQDASEQLGNSCTMWRSRLKSWKSP